MLDIEKDFKDSILMIGSLTYTNYYEDNYYDYDYDYYNNYYEDDEWEEFL